MRTLLANATVITMNPTRDVLDTDILIENGVIADMGPGLAGRPENAGAERAEKPFFKTRRVRGEYFSHARAL